MHTVHNEDGRDDGGGVHESMKRAKDVRYRRQVDSRKIRQHADECEELDRPCDVKYSTRIHSSTPMCGLGKFRLDRSAQGVKV